MPRFLRVSEVAGERGCSVDWFREAQLKGKIPRTRRDLNGWRVNTEEDVNCLKELLVPTPDEVENRK